MVLMLYLRAADTGGVTSAALSLTHGGHALSLFAFAWLCFSGGSVPPRPGGSAGRCRRIRARHPLGGGPLGGAGVRAPWGARTRRSAAWPCPGTSRATRMRGALHGRRGESDGAARRLPRVRFRDQLPLRLLKAVREQAYILKNSIPCRRGLRPSPLSPCPCAHGAGVMGAFIAAQAAWAAMLLVRVVNRWATHRRPVLGTVRDTPDPHEGATRDGPFRDKHWGQACPGPASLAVPPLRPWCRYSTPRGRWGVPCSPVRRMVPRTAGQKCGKPFGPSAGTVVSCCVCKTGGRQRPTCWATSPETWPLASRLRADPGQNHRPRFRDLEAGSRGPVESTGGTRAA